MTQKPLPALQLDLFVHPSPVYQDALDRYEAIRPLLKEEQTLAQQSQKTGIPYGRLRRYLQRFTQDGIWGLLDRRRLPHRRGKPSIDATLPDHIQQQIVRLAVAHPFTHSELARIVQVCYDYPVSYRGIQYIY